MFNVECHEALGQLGVGNNLYGLSYSYSINANCAAIIFKDISVRRRSSLTLFAMPPVCNAKWCSDN